MIAPLRFEDLGADAMHALLTSDAERLTGEQAAGVDDFIERIGGMENAWLAIDMLAQLE